MLQIVWQSQDFTLQSLEFTLKVSRILVHPSKCKGMTSSAQLIQYICYFDNFALLDNSHMFNCTERGFMRIFQVLSKKKKKDCSYACLFGVKVSQFIGWISIRLQVPFVGLTKQVSHFCHSQVEGNFLKPGH